MRTLTAVLIVGMALFTLVLVASLGHAQQPADDAWDWDDGARTVLIVMPGGDPVTGPAFDAQCLETGGWLHHGRDPEADGQLLRFCWHGDFGGTSESDEAQFTAPATSFTPISQNCHERLWRALHDVMPLVGESGPPPRVTLEHLTPAAEMRASAQRWTEWEERRDQTIDQANRALSVCHP